MSFESGVDKYDRQGEMLKAYIAKRVAFCPFYIKALLTVVARQSIRPQRGQLIWCKSTSQVKAQMRTLQVRFEDH